MRDDDFFKLGEKLAQALSPDPFTPSPPGNEVDGHIRLGRVRQTGGLFGLLLEELKEHTLITGRSGCGKTSIIYLIMGQLAEIGIPSLAFDFKQDYRHLLNYKADVHVFNWSNFKFNPLRPPIGCNPVIWMQAFTNVFAQAWHLMAGTKGIIQKHIQNFPGQLPNLFVIFPVEFLEEVVNQQGNIRIAWTIFCC